MKRKKGNGKCSRWEKDVLGREIEAEMTGYGGVKFWEERERERERD